MEELLLPVSAPAGSEEAAVARDGAADVAALLSSFPASPVPTSAIVVRLASLAVLALFSLWANYEASRGFGIEVVNGASGTAAGQRFDLMFLSNGAASRAVYDASRAVERALYVAGTDDDADTKKPVQHVTLRLADGNLPASAVVLPRGRGDDLRGKDEFLLQVSSAVMLAPDANMATRAAIRLGMARVWLWDGQGAAPEALLDAMAEYLAVSASLDGAVEREPVKETGEESLCWPAAAQGRETAARFVRLCEANSRAFVARLNRAMRRRWKPGMVEEALGSAERRARRCGGVGAVSPVGDNYGGWSSMSMWSGPVTSPGWASG